MDAIISANEHLVWLVANFKGKAMLAKKESCPSAFTIDEDGEDAAYKPSEFNYVVKKDNYYLIYNTLYNSLFRFSKRDYSQYAKGTCVSCRLRHKLIQNGFWVKAAIDERKTFKKISKAITYRENGPLSITITTTLKCNAHCPYCYEKGVRQQDLPDDVADRIFDFIMSRHPENGLNLTWFGGEPLMNTPVIDKLCSRLREKSIVFSSYIITNGSLFTDELIDEAISSWNLKNAQITIDGPRDYYEKTKNFDKATGFGYDHILHVVRRLAEKGINVHIRMNITKENLPVSSQLAKELDEYFAPCDKVTFYPAFVSGLKDRLTEEEKLACIVQLLETVSNPQKITASSKFHSTPRTCSCNNSNPRAFTIDVFGNLFACEHNVGVSEKALASIENYSPHKDPRRKVTYIKSKCRTCVFFPKCFGGCKANLGAGDEPCFIEKYILQAYLKLL